ncbi:hypothetical protein ACUYOF_03570 [Photobacterium ganghwense]|uniref:hypothetical protein n=1 Tax=Photobacterium ganghwense TaxID=320778 RepID=UPI0040561C19
MYRLALFCAVLRCRAQFAAMAKVILVKKIRVVKKVSVVKMMLAKVVLAGVMRKTETGSSGCLFVFG